MGNTPIDPFFRPDRHDHVRTGRTDQHPAHPAQDERRLRALRPSQVAFTARSSARPAGSPGSGRPRRRGKGTRSKEGGSEDATRLRKRRCRSAGPGRRTSRVPGRPNTRPSNRAGRGTRPQAFGWAGNSSRLPAAARPGNPKSSTSAPITTVSQLPVAPSTVPSRAVTRRIAAARGECCSKEQGGEQRLPVGRVGAPADVADDQGDARQVTGAQQHAGHPPQEGGGKRDPESSVEPGTEGGQQSQLLLTPRFQHGDELLLGEEPLVAEELLPEASRNTWVGMTRMLKRVAYCRCSSVHTS